uniref:Uncharacterized protein n=1 Tax=Panagrolaimus superbus TaxID=310955 RepID=A0A914YJ92_9BILA
MIKYFLVAKNVFCTLKQGCWQVCSTLDSNETPLNLALNKKFKLHLNGRLSIFFGQAHVSTLLKHVSSCNLTKLQLGSQTITWTEYLKLVSSQTLKIVEFKKCIINDNEGNAIEYEKVLKELPNIEEFEIIFNDKEVTEKTTKMFVFIYI